MASDGGFRFKLGGVPVLLRPIFFVIPVMASMQGGLSHGIAWAAVVLISVLAHELGHASVMRIFGFEPSIELHALGGSTHWGPAMPTARQRFWVSLAGPTAGLAVGASSPSPRRRQTLTRSSYARSCARRSGSTSDGHASTCCHFFHGMAVMCSTPASSG